MPPKFQIYKKIIDAAVLSFLLSQSKTLAGVNSWGKDVVDRIILFVRHGKNVRGSLMLFTCEMLGRSADHDAVACAGALEIFQSGLLIHDDIMDNDTMRRGQPSLHAQYEQLAAEKKYAHQIDFGKAMGICAGDSSFFLAFSLLSTIKEKGMVKELYDLVTKEYLAVCIAQMQDVALGAANSLPDEKDVLRVYLYKTARYTFALPMLIGAIYANAKNEIRQQLSQLGECIGLVFQIQDDILNLVGSQKVTGKPVGSDIREGKKTLAYLSLYAKASPEEQKKLAHMLGNEDLSISDVTFVQSLIGKYDVVSSLHALCENYIKKSTEIIESLVVPDTYKQSLSEMVQFAVSRVG